MYNTLMQQKKKKKGFAAAGKIVDNHFGLRSPHTEKPVVNNLENMVAQW